MGLFNLFRRDQDKVQPTGPAIDTMASPQVTQLRAESGSAEVSIAVPDSPLCYTVDIHRTRDHGAEIVVSLHNTSEDPIFLYGADVHYWCDDSDGGSHPLSFPEQRERHAIKMLQYEVQAGHFHLPNLDSVGELHTRVTVDWHDEQGTRHHRLSQRLQACSLAPLSLKAQVARAPWTHVFLLRK